MSATIPVAVIGAEGRMGFTVCDAVSAAADLELVGRFELGDELGDCHGARVAVEFSVPEAAPTNVAHCVAAGVNVVVGTSGWDDARLETVRRQLDDHPGIGVLVVPNFAIGAVLMMRFAAEAARFYESVEVVELHHPAKVDAPSGTAARTARMIAEARAGAGLGPIPDATTQDEWGARGAVVDGVHVHAIRMRGLVAHQEVVFGMPGEGLTIRHDSYDRVSFMPGVLAGIRGVLDRPGLTVGLEHVIGLADGFGAGPEHRQGSGG